MDKMIDTLNFMSPKLLNATKAENRCKQIKSLNKIQLIVL